MTRGIVTIGVLEERKAASMILEVKIEDDIAAESAVAAEGAIGRPKPPMAPYQRASCYRLGPLFFFPSTAHAEKMEPSFSSWYHHAAVNRN